MKNLLTLLLLVISLLVSGQSNNQSVEVEIKYWKSIAESNDTVAYRQYLNRYGETGLYYDEAITRITLLKTSVKQAQTKSTECCFYSKYGPKNVEYVVRFNDDHSKVWFRNIDYDTVRSNLAVSRDFYENQAVLTMSRKSSDYHFAIETAIGYNRYIEAFGRSPQLKDFLNYYYGWYLYQDKKDKQFLREQWKSYQANLQLLSPDYYKNAWTTDEEYEYAPMKSTSARDVYFKRDKLREIDRFTYYEYSERNNNGQHYTIYVYSDDQFNDGLYKNRVKISDNGVPYLKYSHIYKDKNNRGVAGEYTIKKTMQGYRYIAFSKDKSSFIMWFEEDDNFDGVIHEKREYKRIPKEDLLPKAVNYDFLNK